MSENIKFRIPVLLLLLLTSYIIIGQENDFFNGRILDVTDQSPVAFATIRVLNQNLGVISNEDGSFRWPSELHTYGVSLEVSSLGYKAKTIRITDFDPNQIGIIYLEPSIEELDEVVVTAKRKILSARQIIGKALEKIPDNYPDQPFSYIGYYRDYQFSSDNYVNLNEALIQIYDQGFNKKDYETTKASILKLQKNNEFPRDSTYSVPYDYSSNIKRIPNATIESYSGNELIILRLHDAIRNYNIPSFSFVDTMVEDFTENHQFKKKGVVDYQGDQIYRITIGRNDAETRVKGEIYISATNFGILKLDYQVYLGRINKYSNRLEFNDRPLIHILMEYDQLERYFPKYLSFSNYFEVTPPPVFFVESMVADKSENFFELTFSQKPDPVDAVNTKNYKIWYKKRKLDIDRVVLDGKSRTVRLYPKITERTDLIFSTMKEDEASQEAFEVKFGKIKDVQGNIINQSEVREVEQFREFFVQRLLEEWSPGSESDLMLKDQPIFGNQPFNDAQIKGEYWMNTPLKK